MIRLVCMLMLIALLPMPAAAQVECASGGENNHIVIFLDSVTARLDFQEGDTLRATYEGRCVGRAVYQSGPLPLAVWARDTLSGNGGIPPGQEIGFALRGRRLEAKTTKGEPIAYSSAPFTLAVGARWLDPLPVELASFEAVCDGQGVQLHWRTASETNNAGFYVQRQTDAGWKQIGYVEGAGTTSRGRTYAYLMASVAPGTHRYRLKQVDLDSRAHVTEAVNVIACQREAVVTAPHPSPARQAARFRIAVPAPQHVTSTAYNVLGRRVRVLLDDQVQAGRGREVRFPRRELPAGLYLIVTTSRSFSVTHPVVFL